MTESKTVATGSGNAPSVRIRFESVSGDSLQKRFNKLVKYYGSISQPLQWTAEEFKKSLIANIEKGTIVVEVVGGDYEAKAFA